MVSHCDVAGPAALVGAVEGAGALCCDGKVDGVDSYDGEIYVQGGLGSDSEGEDYSSAIYRSENGLILLRFPLCFRILEADGQMYSLVPVAFHLPALSLYILLLYQIPLWTISLQCM
jgi:hypothetical protein